VALRSCRRALGSVRAGVELDGSGTDGGVLRPLTAGDDRPADRLPRLSVLIGRKSAHLCGSTDVGCCDDRRAPAAYRLT
jgi:hypothetical protein